MNHGKALVFGPVFDSKETYGLGIVKVDSEEELAALIANDPAGKINKYEYYPMQAITPTNKTNQH